jgi:agmatine deiminase
MLRKLSGTAVLITAFSSLALAQYPSQKLPAYRTQKEMQLTVERQKQVPNPGMFGKTGFTMPGKIRYPGEFEESQAVAISWSCNYDNLGNPTDVDTSSEFGFISAQLAKHISDELPVWIRIPTAADSTKIKTYMSNIGWPLTHNYVFFVLPGDDWWMRDYGPNGVYWGDKDSLAFIDLKYYDGRDKDNLFPKYTAEHLGIQNFESTLFGEGGNLMADGFGKTFFSDVITSFNEDWRNWDSTQTLDSMNTLFGSTQNINLKTLNCDGGTGHIDLYVKLLDEQTIVVMEYPDVITAGDKKIIEDNYQYLSTLKCTYDRPFRIIRFPAPTGDNGTYNRKSCTQVNGDARTYINGITLNKTYLYPTYSNDVDGNKTQTEESVALYKKHMPGYKVIPIDARAVSPGGGSIHCITMQIPADNPILFWHPSVDGFKPIQSSYLIEAKITNRSGIATAECKWKKRGTNTWNTLTLTAGTNDMFSGNLAPGTLATTDTIDYYLTATTNNGKTAVKPITAPEGFYTIQFAGYPTAVNDIEVRVKNYLFGAYPNPANDRLFIPYQLLQHADITISIVDITGKEVKKISRTAQEGLNKEELDLSSLNNGIYFYTLYTNGNRIDSRKFVVKH